MVDWLISVSVELKKVEPVFLLFSFSANSVMLSNSIEALDAAHVAKAAAAKSWKKLLGNDMIVPTRADVGAQELQRVRRPPAAIALRFTSIFPEQKNSKMIFST